jgi:hypothetical protein
MNATRLVMVCCLLLAGLIGCNSSSDQLREGVEISSQMSPDGLSRAFVWAPKTQGTLGATSSQPYQVWIQYQQGDKQASAVMKAAATDGLRLSWVGPRTLQVCYGPTHIFQLDNLFDVADRSTGQLYRVEIVLKRTQSLSECT